MLIDRFRFDKTLLRIGSIREEKGMSRLKVCFQIAMLALLGACSTPGRGSAPHAGAGDTRDGQDTVRLVNGDVVQGRILEDSGRQVVIERASVVSTYPRSAIFSIDYSKEAWQDRRAPLQTPEAPADAAKPSTTWLPRTDPREPIQQTEVLFHDTHAVVDCLGPALARTHQDLPDLRLFVEPGGRLLLHDPKQWGYHAHLTGGALRIPAGKPGLSIDLARDEAALPETVAFVSPAQEIKAGDGDGRRSYALPDAVFAAVKPLSVAETLLSVQPFAGGKPAPTPNGALWAFTLPRNSRQFFVYLFDPTRKHGEILKASYAAYGETIRRPRARPRPRRALPREPERRRPGAGAADDLRRPRQGPDARDDARPAAPRGAAAAREGRGDPGRCPRQPLRRLRVGAPGGRARPRAGSSEQGRDDRHAGADAGRPGPDREDRRLRAARGALPRGGLALPAPHLRVEDDGRLPPARAGSRRAAAPGGPAGQDPEERGDPARDAAAVRGTPAAAGGGASTPPRRWPAAWRPACCTTR